jgi:hypothetical protein
MAFDRATSVRSGPHRHGVTAALAVIIAAALAGCGGASIPAPGGGGGGGGGGSATGGGGAAVSNACSLLTATDIQNVVGHAVATSSPFQDQPGQPGCSWSWASETGNDDVSLTVVSPGGRADFDSTRQFDLKFAGGLSSLGAAAASEAAPISSGLAEGLGNVFQVGDVAGLGDAAFMGPGVTIYAVKGDTEIQLQILDVIDTGIPDKTIQLAKIVLGHV